MKTTIIGAITDRRMLRVVYKGLTRIVEKYVLYRSQSGVEILHSWQTAGEYEITPPPDWCNLRLTNISSVTLLDERYEVPHPDYNPSSTQFHHVIASTPKGSSGAAATSGR